MQYALTLSHISQTSGKKLTAELDNYRKVKSAPVVEKSEEDRTSPEDISIGLQLRLKNRIEDFYVDKKAESKRRISNRHCPNSFREQKLY